MSNPITITASETNEYTLVDIAIEGGTPVGRPRNSDRHAQLNLRLPVEVIENLKVIALSEGWITEIGKHKGEPNISGWLADKYKHHWLRNGKRNGLQQWICKHCGKHKSDGDRRRGRPKKL